MIDSAAVFRLEYTQHSGGSLLLEGQAPPNLEKAESNTLDKTSEEVLQVRDNEQKLERFIARHQVFTRRCASKVTKHHVSWDDEEASVALIAFYEAIQAYEKDKGSFLPFAAMVIRRRLLNLGDKNARYAREIPSSQEALDGQFSNEETPQATADNLTAASSAGQSVAIHAREEEKRSLKEEIEEIQQMLEPYGFSFFDLTECSPKAGKTKTACRTRPDRRTPHSHSGRFSRFVLHSQRSGAPVVLPCLFLIPLHKQETDPLQETPDPWKLFFARQDSRRAKAVPSSLCSFPRGSRQGKPFYNTDLQDSEAASQSCGRMGASGQRGETAPAGTA